MTTDALKRSSLADDASERIRAEIIRGQIWPGDRILIADVAERLGVSHIPIREALRRLESEGWITTTSQRHTLAAPVDLTDLEGLYATRKLLEGALSHQAARLRSAQHVEDAKTALDELAQVADHQETLEFWIAHSEFHLALLSPALTSWSRRLLDQLWQGSERYVRLFAGRFGSVTAAMADHALLLDAFAAGDPDEMAVRLESHLTHTETAVREGYRQLPEQRKQASDGDVASDEAPGR